MVPIVSLDMAGAREGSGDKKRKVATAEMDLKWAELAPTTKPNELILKRNIGA